MGNFKNTHGQGFHISFDNGWTVSVQFGAGHYSDNYLADFNDRKFWESTTAETAAFPTVGDGEWLDGRTHVNGRQTPEQVLELFNRVAALPTPEKQETPNGHNSQT